MFLNLNQQTLFMNLNSNNLHALHVKDKRESLETEFIFLDPDLFLLVIKTLFYCALALSLKVNSSNLSKNFNTHSLLEKNKNFIKLLFELKRFVIKVGSIDFFNMSNMLKNYEPIKKTNLTNLTTNKHKQKDLKIYYTYRLTFKQINHNPQQYYMGFRGCSNSPKLDQYYASSKLVKNWLKQ